MPEPLNQQIELLQEILLSEKDPAGRAFAPLADAHRRAGDLDRALEVLQEGLVSHPDFASGHVVAGWLHRDRGEDDHAIRAFERVLELDTENGTALRSLAELAEDPDTGLGYFERLAEIEADDPEVVAALENLRAEVAAGAADPVEETIQIEEQGREETSAEGVALEAPVEQPVVEEASPDAVPVADLAPDDAAAPEMAEVSAPAEVVLEEPVVEAEAPSAGVTADERKIYTPTLAELYAKQGAVDKALEVYRKLLVEDPENPMFLHRVAELTRGLGVGPDVTEEPPVAAEEPSVATEEPPVATEEPSVTTEEPSVVADDRPVVPIQSLAPDPEPVGAETPAGDVPVAWDEAPVAVEEEAVAADDRPVVPIESLAPDPEPMGDVAPAPAIAVEELAPDPEPMGDGAAPAIAIEELAPDPEPVGVEAPVADPEPVGSLVTEEASSIQDDRPVVPIESLAPDGPSDDQGDDPYSWMNKL